MKTIVKTTLSAIGLFLALPACAQQATPAPAAAAQDADPALWVVKDKDTTIYLFGTIHILKPGLSWFDEAVKTAFDRSDELVIEMVKPDDATMQKLVLAQGMSPAGTPPLAERIPADKRAAYLDALTRSGVPAAAFDRMRPWLAAVTLSLGPVQKAGYAATNGPEEVLSGSAKASGKPVIGLETAAQQLGYFGALSDPAQVQFLVSTIDELPTAGNTMAKMVDDWARGDPDALAAEMNETLKDSPEVAKVLLTDRNVRWAYWIKERMQRPGTVFLAVGAGHLAGPDSVQAQLAKLKVKATRVRY